MTTKNKRTLRRASGTSLFTRVQHVQPRGREVGITVRIRNWVAVAGALAVVVLVPPLLTSGADTTASLRSLRVLVPNAPGGGYDVTARTAAKAMEDAELIRNTEVFNLPGAGGTVGLGRTVSERGNGKL